MNPFDGKIILGETRPVEIHLPANYDSKIAHPLLVFLHGYRSTALEHQTYFNLGPKASENGFVYLYPEGIKNVQSERYWKATDACCDFAGMGLDDVGYLRDLIRQVKSRVNIDDDKVFLMGHSNGGFMTYRMACEHPELFAGVISASGLTWLDNAKCKKTGKPLNILHIHSVDDQLALYEGGIFLKNPFPSAEQTVATWQTNIGCTNTNLAATGNTYDFTDEVSGIETTEYSDDGASCPANASITFWKLVDAIHTPVYNQAFAQEIFDWCMAHYRV
ncbi:hypothetical protein FGO68_gene1113 [Halteria grandinella]|uniref:Uncharacterized protein n=1 Tax=Halteria grandinella TaxID=5974 RepID=A0A8J8SVI6_HALGN|nr:hypothetical protein FGO68_gene1113 [Halteria grandinella]